MHVCEKPVDARRAVEPTGTVGKILFFYFFDLDGNLIDVSNYDGPTIR